MVTKRDRQGGCRNAEARRNAERCGGRRFFDDVMLEREKGN